jgi:hypothetical protein
MAGLSDTLHNLPEVNPAEEFVPPEVLNHPPMDGRDFTLIGYGENRQYFPKDQPDPVLQEIRAEWAKRAQAQGQGIAQAMNPSNLVAQLGQGASTLARPLADAAQAVPAAQQGMEQRVQARAEQERQAVRAADPGGALESDTLAAMQKQADLEVDAGRAEAAAEREAAVAKRGQLEQYAREKQGALDERDRVVGEQVAKVAQLAEAARNTKINPKQLWQDAGFGNKLSMLAGVALGGLVSAHGQRNPALDIINRRISENIDAQVKNLDNMNQAVANERSILGDLRNQFGDKLAAQDMMHGIALDQVANDLTGQLAGVKDIKAQARGQELLATINAQKLQFFQSAQTREAAAAQQKFENSMAQARLAEERKQREQQLTISRENNANEMAKKLLDLNAQKEQASASAAADAEKAKREAMLGARSYRSIVGGQGDDGTQVPVQNNSDAAEVDNVVGGAETTLDRLADATKLVELEGRTTLFDEDKTIAKAAMADAIQFISRDEKGVPSDSDVKRAVDRVGGMKDPTEIFNALSPEQRIKVLGYVQDKIGQRADKYVKSRLGQKAAFKYQANSLIGDKYGHVEDAPSIKRDRIEKADPKLVVTRGDRGGELNYTHSPRGEEYRALGETANFRTPEEAKAQATKALQDFTHFQTMYANEKDPAKKQQHFLNAVDAMNAVHRLNQQIEGLTTKQQGEELRSKLRM